MNCKDEFDLYGQGWNKPVTLFEKWFGFHRFSCYRGEIPASFDADVESAVRERLFAPTSLEPVTSRVDRENPYYRIYVGNYIVFYCVIGTVMELR